MSGPRLVQVGGAPLFDVDLGESGSLELLDDAGGWLLRVKLHADTETRTERLRGLDGSLTWGKRYRSELVEPVALTLRLDLYSLRAMAARAVRSKSGRCKSGPVTLKGGKAAKFRRVDE